MYCYTVNWSSLWLYWRCSRYSTSNQQWRRNSYYYVGFGEELNTRKVVRTAYTSSRAHFHGCDRPFHLYALYSSDLNGKWSKMYIGLHVKHPLFLCDFNETRIFLTDCQKVLVSNFMKILPVGVELFHALRRTDVRKLVVAFRNFANAPNKALFISHKVALYLSIFYQYITYSHPVTSFRRCGEELNGMTDSKDRTYFQMNEVSKGQTGQQDLLSSAIAMK